MDSEQPPGDAEERDHTSWVSGIPFAVIGLVVTPSAMALTGMPEGDRSDLLLFAVVVALIGSLAGYIAGTVHHALQATNDLLWLYAGFVVGIAFKILYDERASPLSLEGAAGSISLPVVLLGGLGLVIGGLPALLMRRAGLARQARKGKDKL